MKGYGKGRHQSHKNSIGRKQTTAKWLADQLGKQMSLESLKHLTSSVLKSNNKIQ